MKIYLAFIVAEIKMFYRDRAALFWTLAFPMIMMLIFGFLNFDRYDPPDVGIVDNAHNEASASLVSVLRGDGDRPELLSVPATNDEPELRAELEEGNITALMVIPEGFGSRGPASSLIDIYYAEGQPQEAFSAQSIIEDTLDGVFNAVADVPPQYQRQQWAQIRMTATETKGQGYKGFIVSGIVALSVMQSAVFGVSFTFVRLRSQGVLRRFRATPINPSHFLTAMVITRMIVITAQVYTLLLIGMLTFGITIGPGHPLVWLELLLLVIFTAAVFVSLGLSISSIANTENTAAPIANAIILPMMFLSGIFFPRSVIPDWLAPITDYLPLTYLADIMRAMVNTGESFFSQGGNILGLAVWGIIIFAVSVRVFRWE